MGIEITKTNKLTNEEINDIIELEKLCFLEEFQMDKNDFVEKKEYGTFLLLKENGKIIGYSSFYNINAEGYYYLLSRNSYNEKDFKNIFLEKETTKENICYIHAIMLQPKYRDSKYTILLKKELNAYISNILEKNKGIVFAITISKDGKKFLEKLNFKTKRKYNETQEFVIKRNDEDGRIIWNE